MSGIVPALAVQLTGTLILVFAYLGLYVQERRRYLAMWLASWVFSVARFAFEMLAALEKGQGVLVALSQMSTLWSGALLLWGTYLFLARKASRLWLVLFVSGSLWVCAAVYFHFSFPWALGLVFFVSALANILTGLAFLRFKGTTGPAKWITGWAFILWGLHKADYPFLRPSAWAAPYGYIIGAVFGFVSAVGIILLYLGKTKKELQESERRYRSIFENAAEGIYQVDREGHFLRANPALARMWGCESPEQLMEERVNFTGQIYVDFGDREKIRETLQKDGFIKGVETRIFRKDGEIRWVSLNSRAVKDENNEIRFYEGSVEDITDRKRAEEELRVSRLHLREAADLAKIAYWESDRESNEFIFNDLFYALYATDSIREGGYRMAADEYFRRFVHPDDLEGLCRKVEGRKADPGQVESEDIEHRVIRADGKIIDIRATRRYIKDPEGRILRVVGVNQDITERKSAEETLRATAARLIRAERVSRTGNWELDLSTKTVSASAEAGRIYGLSGEEFPLDWVQQSPLPEYRETLDKALRDLVEKNTPYDVEFKMRHVDDGSVVDVHSVAEYDPVKRTVFGVIQDVTENKKLEEQLRQAQKMEAIGTLAGGVAHDFNNLLTVIMGFANLIQMGIGPDDCLAPYVEQIVASSSKGADLTQSLLAFSRKQRINLEPHAINDIVRNSVKLLKRLLPEDIEVALDLGTIDFIVRLDQNQIDQTFLNLATNARDAMPHGGRLSIRTETITLDEEFVRSRGFGKSGRYVLISVSDTGTGMDEKTKERIFDPFFTTKEVGKGTGLGLASVYGIVTQHQGYITVSSKLFEGTTFHIYLPLEEAFSAKEGDEPEPAVGGIETILIVEDDQGVRNMMRQILTRSGYNTLEAATGEEGIRMHEQHKGKIDLVILDVVMPGKNGKEVLDEIAGKGVPVRAIFISGYTGEIILQKGVQKESVDFLQKPLSVSTLLSKVREVLDRPVIGGPVNGP